MFQNISDKSGLLAIFDAIFHLLTFDLLLSVTKQTVLRQATVVDCDSSGYRHALFSTEYNVYYMQCPHKCRTCNS